MPGEQPHTTLCAPDTSSVSLTHVYPCVTHGVAGRHLGWCPVFTPESLSFWLLIP